MLARHFPDVEPVTVASVVLRRVRQPKVLVRLWNFLLARTLNFRKPLSMDSPRPARLYYALALPCCDFRLTVHSAKPRAPRSRPSTLHLLCEHCHYRFGCGELRSRCRCLMGPHTRKRFVDRCDRCRGKALNICRYCHRVFDE
jgi:hypothetical protein